MIKKWAWLVVSAIFLASCSPPLANSRECSDLVGLDEFIVSHDGIYLGETHGQAVSPFVASCFVEGAMLQGKRVHLSLELMGYDLEQAWALGELGLGAGSPGFKALLESYSANEDISVSYHTPLLNFEETGGVFSAELFEERLATNILAEQKNGVFLIAVGGNAHAMKNRRWRGDAALATAGDYFPPGIPSVLMIATEGGEARNCTTHDGCRLREISPQGIESMGAARTMGLQAIIDKPYDYVLNVGTYSPIPEPSTDNPYLGKYASVLSE